MKENEFKEILNLKTIAVVGLSKHPEKPAHFVPKYMKEKGYKIIPVNPTASEILGEKCYKNLLEIPLSIDIVNIFRPSNEVLPIVRDAITKNVKVIWMQEGIVNNEAAQEALKHGLKVIMDKCIMKEHQKLGEMI